MKIIAIERGAETWPKEFDRAIESDEVMSPLSIPTTLIADSAVVREKTPLFVPDFAANWQLAIAPAITIGRLGKSIAPRFARQYVSGMRFVARLLPPDYEEAKPIGALAATFDGAIAFGPETAEAPYFEHLEVEVGHPELRNGNMKMEIDAGKFEIEKTIALVSRYTLLRTGDIIIPCVMPLQASPKIDTRLSVSVNGIMALNLKIK